MIVIAKEELPIAKSPGLLQLQQKNGIKMSNTSANDTKCAEMVSTVATLIKEEMLLNYKRGKVHFCYDRWCDRDLQHRK